MTTTTFVPTNSPAYTSTISAETQSGTVLVGQPSGGYATTSITSGGSAFTSTIVSASDEQTGTVEGKTIFIYCLIQLCLHIVQLSTQWVPLRTPLSFHPRLLTTLQLSVLVDTNLVVSLLAKRVPVSDGDFHGIGD